MKRLLNLVLIGAMLLCGSPAHAVVMEYIGPDGATPIKVSETHPLPGTSSGGSSGVASATANATDSRPVALYASDGSTMQRLLTAIILGDGVNGNNMLPIANYLWNGVSWDRAKAFSFDDDGNLKMQLASSTVTLSSPVAVDSDNVTLVNIASNTTVMIASLSIGITFQDVRSIASNSNTVLADITSGTAAPFWLTIQNTGVQKIHVDSVAPGDTTQFIAPGETWGPRYMGTNVPNYKFRANSAGTSTWALAAEK